MGSIPFPDGTKFVKLWCVFNVDYLYDRQEEVRALQSELDTMTLNLKDHKVQMNRETDNKKQQIMKKQMDKMEEKLEESRWFHTQKSDLSDMNPWGRTIPVKERRDIQPGIELDYVFHRENDFVPMGISGAIAKNGNGTTTINLFPQYLP